MKRVKVKGLTRAKWLDAYKYFYKERDMVTWMELFDDLAMRVYIKNSPTLMVPLDVFNMLSKRHLDIKYDTGYIHAPSERRVRI